MLRGPLAHKGYDWWWHSFTAQDAETGEDKAFFVEYFICNPAIGEDKPIFGQLPENKAAGKKPSYLMVKAGTWAKNIFSFIGFSDGVRYIFILMHHISLRQETVLHPKRGFREGLRYQQMMRQHIRSGCAMQVSLSGICI